MFRSRFMPCSECGASVDRSSDVAHVCSDERRVDYMLFGLREEVARLDASVQQYLRTATGRFEVWLAARQVRGEG